MVNRRISRRIFGLDLMPSIGMALAALGASLYAIGVI